VSYYKAEPCVADSADGRVVRRIELNRVRLVDNNDVAAALRKETVQHSPGYRVCRRDGVVFELLAGEITRHAGTFITASPKTALRFVQADTITLPKPRG